QQHPLAGRRGHRQEARQLADAVLGFGQASGVEQRPGIQDHQALAADEPETAAGLLQKLTEEQLLHGHNIGMVLALRDELPAA
ncbi:hypothetical protein, partial [Pseudomonas aeruginosa]|uniref:hypothetical protein n=1 Tax=Pseudomonas aeruginosa TaxID=287 RepID=UPI0011441463